MQSTGDKRIVTDMGYSRNSHQDNYHLSQRVIFVIQIMPEYEIQLQSFERLQPKAYSYGKLHLDLLLKALVQIEEVFFIDPPHQPVIALSSDFRTHPENSFTFDTSALSGDEQTLLEQFLEQNHVNSYRIAATFPHEVVSPDGRLIAQDDGIYLVETNQLIAQAPPAFIRGWTSDGQGAIYSSGGLCLIYRGSPFGDGVGCATWVPQPVLLTKLRLKPTSKGVIHG